MQDLPIGPGTRVTLHFTLMLPDGHKVDSTRSGKPAQLDVGDGNLPENFEQLLYGLFEGDSRSFNVSPEKAFGQHNPSNVQSFKRHSFGADMVLERGVVVSFADAGQSELPGVITKVEGDMVTVDFNHPLAGRELVFEVEILNVERVAEPN